MKKYIQQLSALAIAAVLVSFTFVGGESFTIQLNAKTLVDQVIHAKSTVPSVSLANASSTDVIYIYFNECGRIGRNRKLTFRDEIGLIQRHFSFENSVEEKNQMEIAVKDILDLKRKGKLKLYYDSEKAKDRFLATIVLREELKAKK